MVTVVAPEAGYCVGDNTDNKAGRIHMMFGNRIAIAVCVAGLAIGASLKIASAVNGPEALNTLVGNTLARDDRPDGAIFIDKDGSFRAMERGSRYGGKWTFSEKQLCFTAGDVSKAGPGATCGDLEVVANHVTVKFPQQTEEFTILTGNPKGL